MITLKVHVLQSDFVWYLQKVERERAYAIWHSCGWLELQRMTNITVAETGMTIGKNITFHIINNSSVLINDSARIVWIFSCVCVYDSQWDRAPWPAICRNYRVKMAINQIQMNRKKCNLFEYSEMRHEKRNMKIERDNEQRIQFRYLFNYTCGQLIKWTKFTSI